MVLCMFVIVATKECKCFESDVICVGVELDF